MSEKLSPPTQSSVEEATLEGIRLVQELRMPQDGMAPRAAEFKNLVYTTASILSLVILYSDPVIEGWKFPSA